MSIWCEVSRQSLLHNHRTIKDITDKKIVSVVKGNAYGFGLEEVVEILENEVDMYGVSSFEEAMRIKTNKDILIMTPLCEIPWTPVNNHIYTIDDMKDMSKFNPDENYRVHIYVNTGMNRLGVEPRDIDLLITTISKKYKHLTLEGVYTHLHNAGNMQESLAQIEILKEIHNKHKDKIQHFHCLNSQGICTKELRDAATFTSLARSGNCLYGYSGKNIGVEKVFKLKAQIVKRYIVAADGAVGYGAKVKVKKGTHVGVLSCGTIEKMGFKRNIRNPLINDIAKTIKNNLKPTCYIFIDGKPVKELCSPNMNCTLIDLTEISKDETVVDINISTIQIDSNVEKRYV